MWAPRKKDLFFRAGISAPPRIFGGLLVPRGGSQSWLHQRGSASFLRGDFECVFHSLRYALFLMSACGSGSAGGALQAWPNCVV